MGGSLSAIGRVLPSVEEKVTEYGESLVCSPCLLGLSLTGKCTCFFLSMSDGTSTGLHVMAC
jgi:hypothetical protein